MPSQPPEPRNRLEYRYWRAVRVLLWTHVVIFAALVLLLVSAYLEQ
jgi:hypothetical protein